MHANAVEITEINPNNKVRFHDISGEMFFLLLKETNTYTHAKTTNFIEQTSVIWIEQNIDSDYLKLK